MFILLFYFTGSYPPGWKGWHFAMRTTVNPMAVSTPFFSKASIAYSEQVGTKRQAGGHRGEIYRL
jgi:hypothetical protein